jgi:hypothetical protein
VTERQRYQEFRSFTQLTTYMECGEQYRLKYIERHREAPSVWSVGGTAFHTVAERYLRGELDGVEDAWALAWDEAYQDVLDRGMPPGADPDPYAWRAAARGKENPDWWRGQGPIMVRSFAQWWESSGLTVWTIPGVQPDSGDAPELALERELLVTLGGVPVRAIPDALVVDEYGQIDVLDYKSGNASKLPGKDPFQLAVYSAAVEVGLGVKPTWGLFYGTRLAQAYPHDLTRFSAAQIGDTFADFDSKELAGIYKPNPGSQCRFCGVRDHCTYKGVK